MVSQHLPWYQKSLSWNELGARQSSKGARCDWTSSRGRCDLKEVRTPRLPTVINVSRGPGQSPVAQTLDHLLLLMQRMSKKVSEYSTIQCLPAHYPGKKQGMLWPMQRVQAISSSLVSTSSGGPPDPHRCFRWGPKLYVALWSPLPNLKWCPQFMDDVHPEVPVLLADVMSILGLLQF